MTDTKEAARKRFEERQHWRETEQHKRAVRAIKHARRWAKLVNQVSQDIEDYGDAFFDPHGV